MYTHENFTADVLREFQFLESDFGMRREPVPVSGGGSWIQFASPTVRVIVEHELGGYCGVTVQNLRHVKRDPLERSEFDLEEIMAVAGGPRQGRKQDPRSLSEAIARAAQSLRSAGAPVLNGDFEALQTRQMKAVEALRRHHPLED
ncbi:MAG: hypothetical protein ABI779_10245 [Acidobacteriota bacterium]